MYKRSEIFSIPNIMCYFRILLIPVFVYIYFTAESQKDYYLAAGIVALSAMTDMFDGFIARRFNQITELGKLIDPMADKFCHGAMMICLVSQYKLMLIPLALYFIKNGFMGLMCILIYRHNGRKLDGANWYGKVSTAVQFFLMFLLFAIDPKRISLGLANAMVMTCCGFMLMAFILYAIAMIKLYREPSIK